MELTVTREPWTVDALCAQTDPDAFHPAVDEPYRAAIRVCRRCPVKKACLAYAIEHDEQEGIWGGHTPPERRRIANGLPPNSRPLAPCGTVPAYHRHRANGEPTCDACKAALRAYRTRQPVAS